MFKKLIQILIDNGVNIPLMIKATKIVGVADPLIELKEQEDRKLADKGNSKCCHNNLFKLLHMNVITNAKKLIHELGRSGIDHREVLFGVTDRTPIQDNGVNKKGYHNKRKGADDIDVCAKK
jgi:hypothetical protein